jgi:hypothetical protein
MKTLRDHVLDFIKQQLLVSVVLSGLILWGQVKAGLISAPEARTNAFAILIPYLKVLALIILWHVFRTAYLLHVEDQEAIDSLRTELESHKATVKEIVAPRPYSDMAFPFPEMAGLLKSDKVMARIGVSELMDFYKKHTTSQADNLASVYIGTWLQVSGPVVDVDVKSGFVALTNPIAVCYFPKEKHQEIAGLLKGTPVKILGKIGGVSTIAINLWECELL